jgi:hypothetical protein
MVIEILDFVNTSSRFSGSQGTEDNTQDFLAGCKKIRLFLKQDAVMAFLYKWNEYSGSAGGGGAALLSRPDRITSFL